MRLLTIVGARPQFVKSAVVSRAFKQIDLEELMVHTGQHYDPRMSQIFFDELNIPPPAFNLAIGSGSHGQQTGRMLEQIEIILKETSPDAVVVYGDTNSTLAGALAAAKLHIPVVHIEAGLRSFNRRMPEEINRVLTDQVSELLLCPTKQAVAWLAAEGIHKNVHFVGDVMYDSALFFAEIAAKQSDPLRDLGLQPKSYVLFTCHRAENTDSAARFDEIMRGAASLSQQLPVVFPVHPRIKSRVSESLAGNPGVKLIDPASYFDMLLLEKNARVILTDSGGVQKEAFFFGVPCVTMRDETEWEETVRCGANRLVGASQSRIIDAVNHSLHRTDSLPDAASYYGHGQASSNIAQLVYDLVKGEGDQVLGSLPRSSKIA